MRVAILGCGAMGTVLGAYLAKSGQDIELVDSYEAHVRALNENGAHITGSVDMRVPVHAITPEEMEGVYDLVFLLTKQTANDAVLPALLLHLSERSTVCTLQNGVPEAFVAQYVGKSRTIGGAVLWGATFLGPGESELTQDISQSEYLFEIGEIDGTVGERIQQAAKVLAGMGPAKITYRLMDSRWGKLVNNACMSGMSAVCGCTFGQVLDDARALACLCHIGEEVKRCCEADGYRLPVLLGKHDPALLELKDKEQFDACRKMFASMYDGLRPAKASMLQDLEKNKPTEVDMINGFVCSTGAEKGIATPFNDTVVQVVHRIEKGELPLSMDNIRFFDETLFRYGI